MRNLRLMFVWTISFLPGLLWGQKSMPSYLDVVKKFFTTYSHDPEEFFDKIYFAKKKEGWHVDVVDISKEYKVKNEQLFWNAAEDKYNSLSGFGPGLSKEEVDEKIDSMMSGSDSYLVYGFARCRYFGYADWAPDMIKDFGNSVPQNDTLLEGLARAYSTYSYRFLWDFSEFVPDSDLPMRKLGRLEMPGKERIDSFNYFTNKMIGCYKTLSRRNANYKMIVGNVGIKIINEQMNQYMQLNMCGYFNESKKVIDGLPGNDSTCLQIGYAYLNACPLNSILITYGDDDTYPLWYLQQKKGYRKDVTVVNNSLLGLAPYINMLKRDRTLNFSSDASFFGKDGYDYFPYDQNGPPNITSMSLSRFIQELQQGKHISDYGKTKIPAYQVKTINYNIDLPRLKKICTQNNLTADIEVGLSNNLLLSDFMTLDIVNSNMYSRPVCFTSNQTMFDKKYLQQEGTVYRLLPINEKLATANAAAEILKIENYLRKNPSPVLIAVGNVPNSYDDVLFSTHENLFVKLINYYNNLKNLKKAEEWASKYLASYPSKKLNYSLYNINIAEALLKTSFGKSATGMIEKIAVSELAGYRNFEPPGFFVSKKRCLQYLEYLNSLLDLSNQSSKKLETMIRELHDEEEE